MCRSLYLFILPPLLLAGLCSTTHAADDPVGKSSTPANGVMMAEQCAKACGMCAQACDMCSAHCANMLAEGKKDHLATLKTCQDCASVCAAAACITSRHGPFTDVICKACAEACNRCGMACDKHPDDPHMKKCADACRACEKACRDMLVGGHAH